MSPNAVPIVVASFAAVVALIALARDIIVERMRRRAKVRDDLEIERVRQQTADANSQRAATEVATEAQVELAKLHTMTNDNTERRMIERVEKLEVARDGAHKLLEDALRDSELRCAQRLDEIRAEERSARSRENEACARELKGLRGEIDSLRNGRPSTRRTTAQRTKRGSQ
ncbi:MAG: hypothetical protein ABI862_07900 [Ilumatobacteraceae bacterium]